MANTIKKVLDIVSTVIVAVVGILAVGYIVLMICGFKLYTVLSPSMEPAYKTGSVIFVKPVDTDDLKVGDPITYKLAGTKDKISTHRIHSIETIGDKKAFRTKGDANEDVDAVAVDPDSVIGKPVFSIPGLGKLLSEIKEDPSTRFIFIGIAIGLVLLVMLPGLIFDKNDKPKKGKQTVAEAPELEAEADQLVELTVPDEAQETTEPPEEGNTEA